MSISTQDLAPEFGGAPSLVFTDAAATKVSQLIRDEGNSNLKLRVFISGGGCSGFQYGFTFDEKLEDGDTRVENSGVTLLVDPMSIQYLTGAEIDYREGLDGAQFGHLRDLPRLVLGPDHRRHVDRFGAAGGAGLGEAAVDHDARFRAPVAVGRDQDVGGDQRPRFSANHLAHALDHRTQGDDGGDADGNADEKEQQAPP